MTDRIKVNLSVPAQWRFEEYLASHSAEGRWTWSNVDFFLNEQKGNFDYWIVLDEIESELSLAVPAGNTWLVTMEERCVNPSYAEGYLEQFDQVVTSRHDIQHRSILETYFFPKWHIQKSLPFLEGFIFEKQKNLSAIISDKVEFGEQKKRYALINRLKGHFKEGLDWFCRGENPIDDKWDGLSQYKYSIAIENGSYPGYFTEKLLDNLLAGCVTFYWGAPDIHRYFPKELVIPIPIDDFEQAISIIESHFKAGHYEAVCENFTDVRRTILYEYQFYPWLVKLMAHSDGLTKKSKKLQPQSVFISGRKKNRIRKFFRA